MANGLMNKYIISARLNPRHGKYDWYVGEETVMENPDSFKRTVANKLTTWPQEAIKFDSKEEADAYRKMKHFIGTRIKRYLI